ncbi:DUF4130 domain-containing protein [Candidatus Woesearchaeota archaeon]|nr:DUF4130 domain-containing protein [Candidatus Woesearchaeota archaeon]MBW3017564.1 DUF4130 domain-containing protein [Candidatus Woesearchaeota archaeon]
MVLVLIDRHKDFDPKILEELSKQSEAEIKSLTTKEARQYYNMRRAVGGCLHKAKAFTRFQINKKGILYAVIDPEHRIEDLLVRWFFYRFPLYTIVIESKRGCFVCEKGRVWKDKRKMNEVIADFEQKKEKDPILSELNNDDKIWNEFYDSQYIEKRRNLKLFLKNVPKKFHHWDGMDKERNFLGNKSLLEF